MSDGRWFDIYTFSGTAGQEITPYYGVRSIQHLFIFAGTRWELFLPRMMMVMLVKTRGSHRRKGTFTLPTTGIYKVYATSRFPNETGSTEFLFSTSPYPVITPVPLQEFRVATEADNEYVVSKGGQQRPRTRQS